MLIGKSFKNKSFVFSRNQSFDSKLKCVTQSWRYILFIGVFPLPYYYIERQSLLTKGASLFFQAFFISVLSQSGLAQQMEHFPKSSVHLTFPFADDKCSKEGSSGSVVGRLSAGDFKR